MKFEQSYVFWGCLYCGRTVSCPNPSCYVPNTICNHDGCIVQMIELIPKKMEERDKEDK